jgi:hypothetical protein
MKNLQKNDHENSDHNFNYTSAFRSFCSIIWDFKKGGILIGIQVLNSFRNKQIALNITEEMLFL